jgi:DNA polymerase-3 subunit delta'
MFEKLKGNEKAKQLLRRLASEGRIPQSLIFSGRDGIGKRLFALEVACALVCVSLKSGLPCGTCSACSRVFSFKIPTSGKKEHYEKVIPTDHPDVGLIVPNKNTIYINAIRRLADEANFLPYEARRRVYIIDEAEKLGLTQKAAANALLKTLEEPAPTTHIILITSTPAALLRTIRSRCQSIRFAPISDNDIGVYLTDHIDLNSADAGLAASLSKGSLADAISIDLAEYKGRRSRLMEVVETSVRGRGLANALKVSEEIAVQKDIRGYQKSLDVLEGLIRDLILIKSGHADDATNMDLVHAMTMLIENVPLATLMSWVEEIESLKSSLRFNVNKKVSADALFVKMAGR